MLDYIIKENSPTIKKTRFIDSYWKSRVFETYEINDRRLDEKESIIKNEKMEFFHDPLIIDYGHGFLCGTEKAFAVNVQSNSGNRGYNFITKYNNAELYIIDEQELRLEMRDQHSSSFDLAKKIVSDKSKKNEISIKELSQEYIKNIKEKSNLNIFIHFD